MDFQRIVADEKIKMSVPVHFLGEEVAIGVKDEGGSISRLLTEIEVTCLPKDLPEYFELDISGLGLNEMLHLSDITVPDGVEIVELSHGEEHDRPVVSIHVIKAAPIEEDIVDEVAEGEEGEAPAGEAAADGAGGDAEGESDDK